MQVYKTSNDKESNVNASNIRLQPVSRVHVTTSTFWMWLTIMAATMIMAGCGGSGTANTDNSEVPVATQCIPGDSSTLAECGTLIVGLTDADGDFLSYAINVVSLQLEKADGTSIETLPNNTRIDFTQYVDLTEFLTAATTGGHGASIRIRQ